MIGSDGNWLVEESAETVDAQMNALYEGTVPVVMFPYGSEYVPSSVRNYLRVVREPHGPAAGVYVFDPKLKSVIQVLAAIKSGRHGELLGHIQSKEQAMRNGDAIVVRAVRKDGVPLQDSLVSASDVEVVAEQKRRLAERFPGATIMVIRDPAKVIEERVQSRDRSILLAFKEDGYRIGDLQAVGYLRTNTEMFPEGYLSKLYLKMKTGLSGKRGDSYLRNLFCGMQDYSHDVIVSYLATRPICIMGEWRGDEFREAGIIFPTVNIGAGDEKAAFAGYGFFREFWGTPESKTLAMLGIAFFFCEMSISALHGMRYGSNAGTKNFLTPFGFKDTGRIPRYMLKDGKLVDGIPSSLLREDFEEYVEKWLVETLVSEE